MASYRVAHICGHGSDVRLIGPGRERAARLRFMAERPCPDCLHGVTDDRAEDAAARDGLPELDGSEKQVAWANRIRYRTLLIIERHLADHPINLAAPMPYPASLAFLPGETYTFGALLARLRAEPSAKWWIDHAKDAECAGKKVALGHGESTEFGMVTEAAFVARLFGDLIGLDRPSPYITR